MKWKLFGGLLVVGIVAGNSFAAPIPVKNASTAESYQRGAFQPVARVNPKLPIRVQLMNKTAEPVDYIVVTYTNSRRLAPGQTAQLGQFPLPAYFNINPSRDRTAIRYSVSISEKNTAIVEILPSNSGGDHSLNINETGAIYIY